MQSFDRQSPRGPSWVLAVVAFVVLIVLVQLVGRQEPTKLQERFAATPASGQSGSLPLPPVPTNVVNFARTATARLLSGLSTAPVVSTGDNGIVRVEIASITPVDQGLKLAGTVTNISSGPVAVSLDAFKFTDASGTTYASSGSPSAELPAGQRTPIEITLPIGDPQHLALAVELPNQPRFEVVLLSNTTPTPTP